MCIETRDENRARRAKKGPQTNHTSSSPISPYFPLFSSLQSTKTSKIRTKEDKKSRAEIANEIRKENTHYKKISCDKIHLFNSINNLEERMDLNGQSNEQISSPQITNNKSQKMKTNLGKNIYSFADNFVIDQDKAMPEVPRAWESAPPMPCQTGRKSRPLIYHILATPSTPNSEPAIPISANNTPARQEERILNAATTKIFSTFLKDLKGFHIHQTPAQVLISTCRLAFLLKRSAEFLAFVEFHLPQLAPMVQSAFQFYESNKNPYQQVLDYEPFSLAAFNKFQSKFGACSGCRQINLRKALVEINHADDAQYYCGSCLSAIDGEAGHTSLLSLFCNGLRLEPEPVETEELAAEENCQDLTHLRTLRPIYLVPGNKHHHIFGA